MEDEKVIKNMSPQESWMQCWNKMFIFEGRASRSEFWWFQGITQLILLIISFLYLLVPFIYMFYWLGYLCFLMPQLSVSVRRFHDMNLTTMSAILIFLATLIFSAFYAFNPNYISLIVYIVWLGIYVFIFSSKGTVGSNNFGSEPR